MENPLPLQKIAILLSLIASAIGLIVLIGWMYDLAILKSIFPNQIAMKANTAIVIIICGITISFLTKSFLFFYKYLITLISLIVLIIALLTLYQYIFQTNLGIDELLFSDKNTTINVGRMSPTTAFCFLNISVAMILSTRILNIRFRKIFIDALCTTVIVIAGSIFLSYIPNMLFDYHILSSSYMGIHTSLTLVLLAISLILLAYNENNFVWALNPFVTFLCFFGLIFILLSLDAYHNSTNKLRKNEQVIENLQKVLKELSIASINLVSLKSNEDNYLLSGNKKFLENREKDKVAIETSLINADILIPDADIEQQHLNLLKNLLKKRMKLDDNISKSYKTNMSSDTFNMPEENKLIQSIYQTLNQLLNEIDKLFIASIHKSHVTFYQEFLISPLSIYIVMFLLSLGIFMFNTSQCEKKKLDSMQKK